MPVMIQTNWSKAVGVNNEKSGGTRRGVPVMMQTGRSRDKDVNDEKSGWKKAGDAGNAKSRLK